MMPRKTGLSRRAFLTGVGGAVTVGLPFLEGVQDRSAWAADDVPVFGFFVVAACGVVPATFWPGAGALSSSSFAGLATEPLGAFASDLLMVKGCKFPAGNNSCGHALGLCMSLTGVAPGGSGQSASGGGISADMVIAKALNGGKDPLTLYSGAKSYIAERISFAASGNARSAQLNPYATYQSLMGVMPSAPSTANPTSPSAPTTPSVTDELLVRRRSVNDLVREDLATLKAHPRMSADDRRRLDLHLESVLQLENNMNDTGMQMMEVAPLAGCVEGNVNKTGIEAFRNGVMFSQNGNMIEDLVKLHFETVALAFACNANRVATLQWGDGTDGTKYSGISGPGWPFHQISHRMQNDASSGQPGSANYAACEKAHSEVDAIRMQTLAYGLQQFKDRGLFSNSFVYWTNHVATGPDHGFGNLPMIIAGSGGSKLKQGQLVDGANSTNDKVLSTLINTTGASASNFGVGKGATLAAMENA